MENYYTIQTENHHQDILTELHTLQKHGIMCDVILSAEDGEVLAHKVVLMASSRYFRERLSPIVSQQTAKICLKGISVIDLANLVKYIYTGKILIFKDTMDTTLEISEILELNGIQEGYKQIIAFETRKEENAVAETGSGATVGSTHISGKDVHMSVAGNQSARSPNTLVSGMVTQPPNSKDLTVVQDGHVAASDQMSAETAANQSGTNEYTFAVNPYENQYMDVSVEPNTPSKSVQPDKTSIAGTLPKLQQFGCSAASKVNISEAEAQHQDLLTVAIESLSETSNSIGNKQNQKIEQGSGESVSMVTDDPCQQPQSEGISTSMLKPSEDNELEPFVNGKTNTKLLTVNEGVVSNELGGQTEVYTVCLDPSSIKGALHMPRQMRRRTDKERRAEEAAKMYRQKRSMIINSPRQPYVETLQNPKSVHSSIPMVVTRAADLETDTDKQQDFRFASLSKERKKDEESEIAHISQQFNIKPPVKNTSETSSERTVVKAEVSQERFGGSVKLQNSAKGAGTGTVGAISSPCHRDEVDSGGKLAEPAGRKIRIVASGNPKPMCTPGVIKIEKLSPDTETPRVKIIFPKINKAQAVSVPAQKGNNSGTEMQSPKIDKGMETNWTKTPCAKLDKGTETDPTGEAESSNNKSWSSPRKRKLTAPEILAPSGGDDRLGDKIQRQIFVGRTSSSNGTEIVETPENKNKVKVESSAKTDVNVTVEPKVIVIRKTSAGFGDRSGKMDAVKLTKNIPQKVNISGSQSLQASRVKDDNDGDKDYKIIVPQSLQPQVKLKNCSQEELKNLAKSLKSPVKENEREKQNTSEIITLKEEEDEDVVVIDTDTSPVNKATEQHSAETELSDVTRRVILKCSTKGCKCWFNNTEDFESHTEWCLSAKAGETGLNSLERRKTRIVKLGPGSPSGKMKLTKDEPGTVSVQKTARYLVETSIVYVCPAEMCQFSSEILSYMKRHCTLFHAGSDGEIMIKHCKRYSCTACLFHSSSVAEVQKHFSCHKGEKIKCTDCDSVFASFSLLYSHWQDQHFTHEALVCNQCGFTTMVVGNFFTHLKMSHLQPIIRPVAMCKLCGFEATTKHMQSHVMKQHQLFLGDSHPETAYVERKGKGFTTKRPRAIALNKLPVEDFLKELLKRHDEFIKQPPKQVDFKWTESLAKATNVPSFPSASVSVRNQTTKKLYNKPENTLKLSGMARPKSYTVGQDLGWVDREIEVDQQSHIDVVMENVAGEQSSTGSTYLKIMEPKGGDDRERMIIINSHGVQSAVRSKDFYQTLLEVGQESDQMLQVISTLLEAGEEIEIREEDKAVEIMNV